MNEPGVQGPVGGQGNNPLLESITRKAIKPSEFVETQEESPES